jgi:hypothetical protein
MELVPQQQQQSLPPNIQGPPPPYENDFEEAHVQQKNGSSFLSKKLHSLVSAPSSPTPSKKGRGVFSGIFGGKRTSTPAIDSYEVVNGTTRKSLAKPDTSPTLSFSQRVKLHKGIRTGQIPMEALKYTTRSHLALAEKPSSKKPRKKGFGGKATSMDTGMDELDTDQLAEALLAIGDEQPIVAR